MGKDELSEGRGERTRQDLKFLGELKNLKPVDLKVDENSGMFRKSSDQCLLNE